MNYLIIGYGKMGKAINEIAKKRGHHLVDIIDNENDWIYKAASIKIADVAFEFTQPKAAPTNILKCFSANIPVVCGTTGWLNEYDKIKENKLFFFSEDVVPWPEDSKEGFSGSASILFSSFTDSGVSLTDV